MAGLEGLRGKKLHLPDPTADHGSHEEVDDSGKEGNLGKREASIFFVLHMSETSII